MPVSGIAGSYLLQEIPNSKTHKASIYKIPIQNFTPEVQDIINLTSPANGTTVLCFIQRKVTESLMPATDPVT